MKATQQETRRRILPVILFMALLTGALVAAGAAFAGAPIAAPGSGAKTNAPNSTPTAGTVAPGQPANFSGTTAGTSQDPSTCVYGVNCDKYLLTVVNPSSNNLRVKIQWPISANDLDLYLCQGTDANPCTTQVATSASSTDPEELQVANAAQGNYYVVVVNFAGSTTYTGTATLDPPPPTPVPGTGPAPRYQNYTPPAGLGTDAGEPSIGVNWNTEQNGNGGTVLFQSYLTTLRVSFDITCSQAIWLDKSAPTSVNSLDPILFTDHDTGRTFVSQLTGENSLSSFTDNDGETYTPSTGGPINSGPDHQTIGGGPFAPEPLGVVTATTAYTHAVYYCSQAVATAFCGLSRNGGIDYNGNGGGIPIYTIADGCGGLHGHVKVAPDGTVYVPNKGCGSTQAVSVSDGNNPLASNGKQWSVRHVTGSTPAIGSDPSIGIATDGTAYFGYQDGSGHPKIAVSHDRGLTWINNYDVGAALGIQNSVFPEVVAGDPNRAAFAFVGTTAPGNYEDAINFHGIWHMYVASTFDGGLSWITVDSTPNDPVQRGSICTGGTTCGTDRNLLDFNDIVVDKEGRVLVGYADGCIGGCVQGGANSFSALATIGRQSGGPRLYARYDPVEPVRPSAPQGVTATRQNNVTRVSWTAPDNGGSPITSYKVYRGTTPGGETLLASGVTQTSYTDTSANSGTYYYQISAVNSQGESVKSCEVVSVVAQVQNPCVLPGALVITDDADAAPNTPPDPAVDIRQLFVAEPYMGAGVNKLVFTLKVGPATTGSAPPSSQWYIIFNRSIQPPDPTSDRAYVAMKSDASSAVTYEYGTIQCPAPACVPGNLATRLGAADSGTYDAVAGTITITVSNNKLDNIGAGQSLAQLQVRTFYSRPDSGVVTQTSSSDYSPYSEYTLVGNGFCATGGGGGTVTVTTTAVASTTTTVTRTASGTTTQVAGTATRTSTSIIPTITIPVGGTSTPSGTTTAAASTTRTTTGTTTSVVTGTTTRTATSIASGTSTSVASGTTTSVATGSVTRTATSIIPTLTLTVGATSSTTSVPTGSVTSIATGTTTSVATVSATRTTPSGTSTSVASGTTTSVATGSVTRTATSIIPTLTLTVGATSSTTSVPTGSVTRIATGTTTSVATVSATRTTPSGTTTSVASGTTTAVGSTTSTAGTTSTVGTTSTAGTTATGTVPTASVTPTVCDFRFQDVDQSNTFYPFVECLACKGIIGGYPCGGSGEPCGTSGDPYFRPGNNVSRGQISKIVSESADFQEDPGSQIYEDVLPGSPFYVWINRLSRRNIMGGYPCGGSGEACGTGNKPYFRPSANASRGQLSKIVSNAAGFSEDHTSQTYEDVAPGSPFYIWVERLTSRNVMAGYPCGGPGEPCGTGNKPYFRPNASVTRGQTTKIVSNTFFPNCQNGVTPSSTNTPVPGATIPDPLF